MKRICSQQEFPAILKELKHLSIDAETPISDLIAEAIKYLLKKYKKKDEK
jgi:hypothetical protein